MDFGEVTPVRAQLVQPRRPFEGLHLLFGSAVKGACDGVRKTHMGFCHLCRSLFVRNSCNLPADLRCAAFRFRSVPSLFQSMQLSLRVVQHQRHVSFVIRHRGPSRHFLDPRPSPPQGDGDDRK